MTEASFSQVATRIMRETVGRPTWPTIIASVVLLSAFAGSTWAALSGAMPLWLAALVNFVAIHAGFTVVHEAVHRAMSGGRPGWAWIDTAAGTVHSALLIYDFPTFRHLHLRHHQYTNEPAEDPDYWLQRFPLWQVFFLSFLVPLHYLKLYVAAGIKGNVKGPTLTFALVRIGALGLLILALLLVSPVETLALWLVPAGFASALISISHRMLHEAEETSDRLKTVRIVRGERVWEWLICPFFWLNNHHYLHHEYPRVPCLEHDRMFRDAEPALRASGVHIVTLGAQSADRKVGA